MFAHVYTIGLVALAIAVGVEPATEQLTFPNIRPGIDDRPYFLPSQDVAPARERLDALFAEAGVEYPPRAVVLAAFKEERALDLYARARQGPWHFIHRYRIWGASGSAGPKLQEGDMQVPEGLYKVTWLHGKSSYHRAIRLNYPNAFDRKMAAAEKRTDLGGDIEIHGGVGSIGCLAMGDPAIEELYELVGAVRRSRMTIVISPFDMRRHKNSDPPSEPEWTKTLYENIRAQLDKLPPPPQEKRGLNKAKE